MNNQRGNGRNTVQTRSLYITLALAMVALAVLVALTGIWRNAKKPAVTDDVGVQVMAGHTVESKPLPMTSESVAATSEGITSESVADAAADVLPTFTAPTAGSIAKSHSGDVPVFSLTMNDYRPHRGVDISAKLGDNVYAAADGQIGEVWEDPMNGTCMSIRHAGGAVSIYKNLSPEIPDNIAAGVRVSAGEAIASVGESSLVEIADECHLHYELEINGVAVDPAEYIAFPTSASYDE